MSQIESQLRRAVQSALRDGWSMRAIAKSAGVPHTTIREWYADGREMRSANAWRLAGWFGMRLTRPRVPARERANK